MAVEGDDRLGPACGDQGADGVCVVATVGDQAGEGAGRIDQRSGHGHVVDIAGGELENARATLLVGQSVELGRTSTARGADSLEEGPPFAPAAERWVLMCVASIATVPQMPLCPVSASKMPSQMPCRLHAAGAAFALQKAHYAALTASITATVVLLISLGETSPVANAEHRIVATLIGGILALVVALVVPHSLPRSLSLGDRVGIRRAS